MSVLLLAFEPAPVAASMEIDEAGTTADAVRRTRSACEGRRRRSFLVREEWAQTKGRKFGSAVAAKAVEASADPGQISP
ncbi:hypothetical protein [Hyphomonas pacifica]|uniref:Uncharacterized protein n=1 Tax=Hyphomonas pacifica TaxID=1280941 RepID=A0A062TTD5_9PROT|nr:hypothetical protein [Hyphomonas pacifica]KCZ51241.1 hypothetical protein HY2_11850 [Hyphomonas pacifica]RAN33524.1 hypothetical protein HY3_12760 [Hyphomonas pacifica]